MKQNTIQITIFDAFLNIEDFSLKEATSVVKEKKQLKVNDASIRARIYEGIEKGIFKKISRGVYKVQSQLSNCLLIQGDGRDLSMIDDNSIDGIVTDHPYDTKKSLKGGNRDFASYELFKYQFKDFQEKYRVLKEGTFLVEFLPEENADNFEYLYEIKQLAIKAGFKYYSKVPWKKGNFIANTGRKSKNTEDILFFTKGQPRTLRNNAKKNIQLAKFHNLDITNMNANEIKEKLVENGIEPAYMVGTKNTLPTTFDFQPKPSKQKIMEAEKPIDLLKAIIKQISKPFEILLDQFAGSGNFGLACLELNRNSILIEKSEEIFTRMKKNIGNTTI